jgi:hypothetical protein
MDKETREVQTHHADADTPEDVAPLLPGEVKKEAELEAPKPREDSYRATFLDHYIPKLKQSGRWIGERISSVNADGWLMVIFTGVLTWVGYQQFELTKQNNKSSGEQVQQIITAANRIEDAADSFSVSASHINSGVESAVGKLQSQVDQTKELAQTSQDALVSVQRAFVSATPVITELKQPNGSSDGVSLDISWQNSGSTPTKFLQITDQSSYDSNFSGDPETSKNSPLVKKAKIFISPKGSYNSHLVIIPQFQLENVLKKQTIYFFWGTASYRDVFNGTEEHITKYCYYIDPFYVEYLGSSPPKASYRYESRQCEKGNCIDDECKAK